MRWFVDLYGSEGEDSGDEDEAEEQETGTEEGPETKTLTAQELEAIAARASGRASRKATKDLAKEFGFESVSAMKEFVAAQKQAQDEARSDEEKAKSEAEQARQAAAEERTKLRTERLDLEVQRGIVSQGITDQKKLDRISALVRAELDTELEEDEWPDGVIDAISAIKADMPELFSSAKVPPGSGDGGARGSSTKDEQQEEEERWSQEYAAKGLGIPGSG